MEEEAKDYSNIQLSCHQIKKLAYIYIYICYKEKDVEKESRRHSKECTISGLSAMYFEQRGIKI